MFFVEFEEYVAEFIVQKAEVDCDSRIPFDRDILTKWIKLGIKQYENETGYRFNIE